jgi:hypothetical protein
LGGAEEFFEFGGWLHRLFGCYPSPLQTCMIFHLKHLDRIIKIPEGLVNKISGMCELRGF